MGSNQQGNQQGGGQAAARSTGSGFPDPEAYAAPPFRRRPPDAAGPVPGLAAGAGAAAKRSVVVALLAMVFASFPMAAAHANCKAVVFGTDPWFSDSFWGAAGPAEVQACLDQGRKATEYTVEGLMPLHLASFNSTPGVVEMLIDNGAPLDVGDLEHNATPLHSAAGIGRNPEIVAVLLRRGAYVDPKDKCGNTPLLWAANAENFFPEVAESLISHGADVNVVNCKGETPMHGAAIRPDSRLIELLISHGAKAGAREENGMTPLHAAAKSQNDPDALKMLIDHGAKLGTRDKKGNTALHWAASNRNPAVLEFLLDAGADPDIKNLEGRTAYQLIGKRSPLQGSDVFWRLHDLHHE